MITFGINIYAADKFDIQVCEAQPTDASKIECYNSLRLNTSCNNMESSKQLSCYRKSAEALSPHKSIPQSMMSEFRFIAQGGQSIVATTNTSVSANNTHIVVFTPHLEKTDGNLYQAAIESMIYFYGKERGLFQLKDAKMLPEPSIGGNAICWKVQNPESDYCVIPTKDDVTGRIVGLQVWMK